MIYHKSLGRLSLISPKTILDDKLTFSFDFITTPLLSLLSELNACQMLLVTLFNSVDIFINARLKLIIKEQKI